MEANVTPSDLPSYTIASGLPSYEEALEQLKSVQGPLDTTKALETKGWIPHTPPTPQMEEALSVVSIFPFIDNKGIVKNTS